MGGIDEEEDNSDAFAGEVTNWSSIIAFSLQDWSTKSLPRWSVKQISHFLDVIMKKVISILIYLYFSFQIRTVTV